MRQRNRWVPGAAAALLLVLAAPAWALMGKLDKPGVALPVGYPATQQVMAALNRKDATFVDGHFINSFTSLRYRGNWLAFNLFLEDLAACPGVSVSVRFKHLPDDVDWRVGHDGLLNGFLVEINPASKRLDLERLVIPVTKGPTLPPVGR
jgi:hypothetical protein